MLAKARKWVIDRFALKLIYDEVLDRRVAKGAWYSGDGTALLFLFSVQIVTGVLLGLTYSPAPDEAYESVQHITSGQILGWFIRGLHYWSAGMMVVMLFFHLLRQILVAGYKSPREGTWLVGVALFFLVLTMSFTGYVLRWDERAIYALKVALHMFYYVPLIGDDLVVLVQGGEEIGTRTLTRIFGVHAIILPIVILGLAGYHLYLIIVRGTVAPTEHEEPVHSAKEQKQIYKEDKLSEERGETFYPTTMMRSGTMGVVVFLIALALTLTRGAPPVGPEANLTSPSFPAEEWWFWWYSALIALLPPGVAQAFVVAFPLVLFLALTLLPFVDRSPYRGIRKRPVAILIVASLVIGIVYLSSLRMQSPWTGWPDPNPPPVPVGVSLAPEAEEGRRLYAQYGCTSCHAIAGHGRQVGTDLARLGARYSRDELFKYIRQPPDGVPMPAYEKKMTPEELERVVEFVLVAQTFPREQ